MKNILISFLLFALSTTGFSQGGKYEYFGRLNPCVKKEKLADIKFVTDLSPVMWHLLVVPYKERIELDEQRKINYPLGFYVYPQGGYNLIVDYVSVEISTFQNGKIYTSKSTSDVLTAEQKKIINSADLGSDITVKIMYKHKSCGSEKHLADNEIIEGTLAVTVVPETEAEFPDGYKGITNYLMENVINKISTRGSAGKLGEAIVKFTINEDGQVVDAKLSKTTPNEKIDKILLDAFTKMPKWKPAKNSKGIKVKQEFNISFGNVYGC